MTAKHLAVPTDSQLQWADCELGVIIHQDLETYDSAYAEQGIAPAELFAPAALDTDQWLETSCAAGARYAVLVAKHNTGFCLWPTDTSAYCVRSSPWKDGKGDVVAAFIRSCEKYHVRPGIYYSTSVNRRCGVAQLGRAVGGPAAQAEYNRLVLAQLGELWSRYGRLFELWFDGGVLPVQEGGPDIGSLLCRLQPDAVCYQGPDGAVSRIRWIGNERGEAPAENWNAVADTAEGRGDPGAPFAGPGDPQGNIWMPAEADMPNRDQKKAFMGGWFWRRGEDDLAYSREHLLTQYDRSVGRSSNMLLGMAIDNRGLVPAHDRQRFAEFGLAIRRRYQTPLAQTDACENGAGWALPQEITADTAVIMEDIRYGERIRSFELCGLVGRDWRVLAKGGPVGHKRILHFPAVPLRAVRLRCLESAAAPKIRRLALHRVDPD